jgi:hypothetical protein
MRPILCALVLAFTSGCVTFKPPRTVPPDRTPTPVDASFDRSWDAVIDVFAERNIPISTIDRSSGLIATTPLSVGTDGLVWADCGTEMDAPLLPESGTYNVLVRGDSAASTVRVNVRWAPGPRSLAGCVTKGVYEAELEELIAAIAEERAPVSSARRRTSAIELARGGAAVVAAAGATVYEEPDTSSRVISRLAAGTPVGVIAVIDGRWVRVLWGGVFDRRRGMVQVSELAPGR